ncbi:hypothetical protein EYF80_026506 [Liparis tanakae]|uniref:Uncharacterized protein n=1 Tax=Liparis tanakae TaxID=230148 RepID=A0A4Z2HDC2_9TELE|nr:hypothetical protein EYF80_026506 [Liparis tanakae]
MSAREPWNTPRCYSRAELNQRGRRMGLDHIANREQVTKDHRYVRYNDESTMSTHCCFPCLLSLSFEASVARPVMKTMMQYNMKEQQSGQGEGPLAYFHRKGDV